MTSENHESDALGLDDLTDSSQTFDHVLTELQRIVEQLERSELPLEKSLKAFEQGIALARRGQQILDTAEKRVEILLQDETTAPFS